MRKTKLQCELEKKQDNSAKIAKQAIGNPKLIPELIAGISAGTAGVRFKSAKILRAISDQNPNVLYSNMEFFIRLLGHDNNIIKWNAQDVIANLTTVDKKNNFDKIFKKYYQYLYDESMVTAAHVIDNSGIIAVAKPKLQTKITTELLKIDQTSHSSECKNILKGKAILSFGKYYGQLKNKEQVLNFVKKQLKNRRPATKKKAEKFLKKYDK
ncbi:MAG: hypothetical protein KAJ51_00510 [Thermoplasmata archaeon]|nr:hypothetical protein [Thermoplasmata archaeon]